MAGSSFAERLKQAAEILLGVSAYEKPPPATVSEDTQEEIRTAIGGNIQPLPATRLRWYLDHLEHAQVQADQGYIMSAAQLCRAMNRDGVIRGLLGQRTKGLTRLPKRFFGDDEIVSILRAENGSRSVFDEMCPPSELTLLDADGIKLGIGVAEFVPVKGRPYPVLVRLQPENLVFRWNENRWYFRSLAGDLPVVPGNGRWVLHVPGGRQHPWESGVWYALGRAFIQKEHAMQYRANYVAKLANPARLAYAPIGATEAQRTGFFRRLMAWGSNNVFELPVGWDAKLLESNGRGWEVFQRQIDTCDKEIMVALAGQILTTQGGTGFDGQDVAETIRQDLIQGDGEDMAYTIAVQCLPPFIAGTFGAEALDRATVMRWDTGTPQNKEQESRILTQCGAAIKALNEALAPYDRSVEWGELTQRFGVPTQEGAMRAEEVVAQNAGQE